MDSGRGSMPQQHTNEAAIVLQSEFFSEVDSRSKACPVVKYSLAALAGLL